MQRNLTIDIAKGIGLLLIVYGHNWLVAQDKDMMFRIIYSFHLPLFFFLSGVLVKDCITFREIFVSKCDSLLKPFLVVLFSHAVVRVFTQNTSLCDSIVNIAYGTWATIGWPWTPMWFLPHLFLVHILSWVIINRFVPVGPYKKKILAGIVIIFVMANSFITDHLFGYTTQIAEAFRIITNRINVQGLPLSMDLVLLTTACYVAGFVLSRKVKNFEINIYMLAGATLLFLALHNLYENVLDLNLREFGNPIISTTLAATGIYLTLSVSKLITASHKVSAFLTLISSTGVFILIFHYYFETLVSGFMYKKMGIGFFESCMLGFAAGVFVPLMLHYLVRKNNLLAIALLPIRTNANRQ